MCPLIITIPLSVRTRKERHLFALTVHLFFLANHWVCSLEKAVSVFMTKSERMSLESRDNVSPSP